MRKDASKQTGPPLRYSEGLSIILFLYKQTFVMSSYPTTEVKVNGRVWKVTRLRTAHGAKTNKWVNQIKGGSSRVRCASNNGVTSNTKATALMDVR